MRHKPLKKVLLQTAHAYFYRRRHIFSHFSIKHHLVLIVLCVCLLSGALEFVGPVNDVSAVNPGAGKVCTWHTVRAGDTLSRIAWQHGSTIWILARTNHIANVNLIYINQRLCIPVAMGGYRAISGLLANGAVRWYAHNALEHSTQPQVVSLLYRAAARYGLPPSLLLAIAWQESGWRQHVISPDGGIGTMQIMPYTAMGLNRQVRARYDPYKLADNIELGAIYLSSLWRGFGGNIVYVISAYNQGGWSVKHRGIFNWPYVRSVQALMRRF